MPYERLQDVGSVGMTRGISRKQNRFVADFGGGYFALAYRGHKDGLRNWTLTWKGAHKAARIITNNDGNLEDRVNYVWNFFVRHTAPDHTPIFELEDVVEPAVSAAREVFTCVFDSDELSQQQGGDPYQYGFSLKIRQVNVPGYAVGQFVSEPNPLQI